KQMPPGPAARRSAGAGHGRSLRVPTGRATAGGGVARSCRMTPRSWSRSLRRVCLSYTLRPGGHPAKQERGACHSFGQVRPAMLKLIPSVLIILNRGGRSLSAVRKLEMPKGVEYLCTADRLFDGTGTAALSQPVLRISGERVEAVGTGQFPPESDDAKCYDFPGCTILPGLIDTHVHLVFSALHSHAAIIEQVTDETDAQLLRRALANAQAALHAGVTTVRDCGGRGRVVQEVRDRIRRGEAEGADVLACGSPITTRTGHCHWLGLVADTPQEVRSAAERMLAEGADFLKVMATRGHMTPPAPPMRGPNETRT